MQPQFLTRPIPLLFGTTPPMKRSQPSRKEELARMKGMKGVVQKLRSHLVVQGDTTLRPLAP